MPPRFSYWTIIAGGLPTAFRAAEREELLPTFTRLKEKQPDAEMKWFARGKLWSSPEEARGSHERTLRGRHDQRGAANRDWGAGGRTRGAGGGNRSGDARPARGRDWRPGGEHRDPRQPFIDAKKARNQRIKAAKFDRRSGADRPPRERPHGDPLAPERPRGPKGSRQGQSRRPERPAGSRPTGPAAHASAGRSSKQSDRRPATHRHATTHRAPHTRQANGKGRAPRPMDRDRTRPGQWQTNAQRPNTFTPRPPQGREAFRGKGHGDNAWTSPPPRKDRPGDQRPKRPFEPRGFDRGRTRGAGTEEAAPPPRPPGPNREPRPSEEPRPSAPPRPAEPVVPPPGPPERGRLNRNKRR